MEINDAIHIRTLEFAANQGFSVVYMITLHLKRMEREGKLLDRYAVY